MQGVARAVVGGAQSGPTGADAGQGFLLQPLEAVELGFRYLPPGPVP